MLACYMSALPYRDINTTRREFMSSADSLATMSRPTSLFMNKTSQLDTKAVLQ